LAEPIKPALVGGEGRQGKQRWNGAAVLQRHPL